jgi:Tfp pilus assembly protein PilE
VAAVLLSAAAVMLTSCGDESTDTGTASSSAADSRVANAEDRAARIAAQSSLRNAQMNQEAYFAENGKYASSFSTLKTIDDRLNMKIKVIKGDSNGYEMSIEAADSDNTVYIVRRTGSRVEHVDENDNSW